MFTSGRFGTRLTSTRRPLGRRTRRTAPASAACDSATPLGPPPGGAMITRFMRDGTKYFFATARISAAVTAWILSV